MRSLIVVSIVLASMSVAWGAGIRQAAAQADGRSFGEWLKGVREEALERGIRAEIVEAALDGLEAPLPVVLEHDRSQAEVVLPLETYIARRVTPAVVRRGRQSQDRHAALLQRIAAAYGVPPSVIVAIWGVESNFGRFTGVRPTIAALATLAWDPRRATFFRGELFSALEIVNRGDIELPRLKGSWAGAMGQPQFMPSSYLRFAVDFDEDGRRDIWDTPADVFASVANYLKGHGWVEGYRWGREVQLSREAAAQVARAAAPRGEGSCRARREMTAALPLATWQELGVRLTGGGALPKADQHASLVSGKTRHFLVYENYEVILSYNCAHSYALSVALLAEQIGS